MSGAARIGIFGGSFDPIHTGHLILAQSAQSLLDLDRVYFLPTANPPHKMMDRLTEFAVRERMVSLAIDDNPLFELSRIEGKREISFTYETVLHFKEKGFGKGDIHLLVGTDSLADIPDWKNPELIYSNSTIVALKRPGYGTAWPLPEEAAVIFIETGSNSISSSEIRKMVAEGRSIRYLVPGRVEEFIIDNRLYLNGS